MNRSGSPQLNRPIMRREVIKGAGAGLLSLGLMGLNTPGILQAKQEQPNIVFILYDIPLQPIAGQFSDGLICPPPCFPAFSHPGEHHRDVVRVYGAE